MGGMYVMEGSTLGGQVISRHLEQILKLHDGIGYSYFRGHQENTGRIWKEFCEALTVAAKDRDWDAIVTGARRMFLAFSLGAERLLGWTLVQPEFRSIDA